MNVNGKIFQGYHAFARGCALVAVMACTAPFSGACTNTFPQGDYLNLAAILNLVTAVSVASTAPADGAGDIPLSDDMVVIFNRAMDTSTVSVQVSDGTCAGTIQLSADDFSTCVGGSVSSFSGDTTFVFNPTNNLTTSTNYKLKVTTAGQDTQGDFVGSEFVMANGFTTAQQPAIVSWNPADMTTNVPVNSTFQFTLNKAIEPLSVVSVAGDGSCAGRSVLLSSDSFTTCLGGTISTSDNTTFTFTPTGDLTPGQTYAFAVAGNLQDSFGNSIGSSSAIVIASERPPATLGGGALQFWYAGDFGAFSDAGATAANNGDQIRQWNDLSGNSFNTDQATLNQRPRYVQNILNGHAIMRFDGVNDYLDIPGVTVSPTATSYTLFTVHRVETVGFHALLSQQNGAGTGRNILMQDSACNGANHRMGTNFGGADSCGFTNVTTSTWYITTTISNMTNVSFYLNGNFDGTSTPTIENATGSWRIGATKTGAGPLDGDIAEIIAYNTDFGAADRRRIECYLSTRYGIAVSHTCN